MNPNIVLFRMPDEDHQVVIAEIRLEEDGLLIKDSAVKFYPAAEDFLHDLTYSELILGSHVVGADTWEELARVNLMLIGESPPLPIYADVLRLQRAIFIMISDYFNDSGADPIH